MFLNITQKYLKDWRKEPNVFIIGAAIRLGDLPSGLKSTNEEHSPHVYLSSMEVDTIWNCAQSRVKPGFINKFFIVTDSKEIKAQARIRFGDKLLDMDLGGNPKHILKAQSKEEMLKTVVEHYLFGECDEIIITPESTFGGTAMLRTAKLGSYPVSQECRVSTTSYGPYTPNGHGQLLW